MKKKTGYLRDDKLVIQFGNRLKQLRLEKGFSQEKLAKEAGITFTYISKIEHGKVNTSLCHMGALAKALKIPIQEILNFE